MFLLTGASTTRQSFLSESLLFLKNYSSGLLATSWSQKYVAFVWVNLSKGRFIGTIFAYDCSMRLL